MILDSNLFELEDGRKIKLAGIDAPQLNNPIPLFAETAKQAITYHTETILKRRVVVQSISKADSNEYEFVYLWLEYPLENLDFNQKFLERGFGKFINNVDSTKTASLMNAEKYAKENNEGIWEYYKQNVSDTLDGDLRDSKTAQIINIDSTGIKIILKPRPLHVSIPLELFVGSATTLVTSLASGLLYAAVIREHGEYAGLGAALFGIAIGYVFGFPSGVYLVASHDNPNLSYLATLGSSLVMTLITSGIAAAYTGEERTHFTRYIAAFSPIIGTLLYVHVFPPAPPTKEELMKQNFGYKKIDSFKDFYDAGMSFRMELMRIYF
ncbi:MAG: thermonuclease family protein [Ignavibacteriales bacterium]|nr:thermonuclease family protein [Ignavibacteriales bacterium]